MKLEEKIQQLEKRVTENCQFNAIVLENLMDGGSTVNGVNGVNLYLPIEKLNYLIDELHETKRIIEQIDLLNQVHLEDMLEEE